MAKTSKRDVTKKEILSEFIRDTKRDIMIKEIALEFYQTDGNDVKKVMAAQQEIQELQTKLAFFERLLKKA